MSDTIDLKPQTAAPAAPASPSREFLATAALRGARTAEQLNAAAPFGFDYPATQVGVAGPVTVSYDPALGASGLTLAQNLLKRMAANHADFTLTFRRLCDAAAGLEGGGGARALFADPSAYDSWAAEWRRRLEEEPVSGQARAAMMRRSNPAFIPRNHVVEAALDAAVNRQDFQPFEELLDVVSRPYEDRPDLERYTTPARPEECVSATFCGT